MSKTVKTTKKRATRRPKADAVAPARKPKRAPSYKRKYSRSHYMPGLFSTGGSMIGGALGGPIGAKIGSAAGNLLSTVTGFGDYEIAYNSLHPNMASSDVPQVVNSMNRGGVIIRHREYLGDITASTGFSQQQYFINPGLANTFPWLSNVAAAYEEYEFRGMVFEFKSLSSDAVLSTSTTSSALGFIAMATQYNPANGPFFDKHEMENYEYANSRKPSESFCHAVECKRRLNFDTHLYIRNGAVPAGQDQKTYDLGAFSIAVGGTQQSTGVLGELWCSYEVEFFHPKYKYNSETLTDHFKRTGFSSSLPLGIPDATGGATNSNLGSTITSGTNGVITLPNFSTGGQYMISILWVGTASTAITFPNIAYQNSNGQQYWVGDTANVAKVPSPGATSTTMLMSWVLQPISGAPGPASIVLTSGNFPTGTQYCDIWITEVSSNIIS